MTISFPLAAPSGHPSSAAPDRDIMGEDRAVVALAPSLLVLLIQGVAAEGTVVALLGRPLAEPWSTDQVKVPVR
jgi:hypothetical protein